jgi:predicted lipoprotein with Yx(FWY)xxD motif
MRGFSRKPVAVLAGFVLLGLGLSAAFLLPSSGAQGTATYTYPKPPPKTTTSSGGGGGGGSTTTEPETSTEETTAELPTTAAEPTTTTTTESTTTTTTATPAPTLVRVRIRSLARLHATVLVDQAGKTLYHFTREKARRVLCTGGCASVWPPLLVGAGLRPLAGLGVNRLRLGTIRRVDGKLQATYMGFALYRFSGDTKPGDAKGQGFGKAWFAIRPSGRLVGA